MDITISALIKCICGEIISSGGIDYVIINSRKKFRRIRLQQLI